MWQYPGMNLIESFRRELLHQHLDVGTYYRIDIPTLNVGDDEFVSPSIYGEILERTEINDVVWVKAYSRACPDGEVGQMQLSEISMTLTRDEFDTARNAGWPDRGSCSG